MIVWQCKWSSKWMSDDYRLLAPPLTWSLNPSRHILWREYRRRFCVPFSVSFLSSFLSSPLCWSPGVLQGSVNYKEFLLTMSSFRSDLATYDEAKFYFEVFDVNGSGTIRWSTQSEINIMHPPSYHASLYPVSCIFLSCIMRLLFSVDRSELHDTQNSQTISTH